jgi:hypothetical protein
MDTQIIISKNKQGLEYIPSPCLKSKKSKALRRNMGKVAVLMYRDFMEYIGSQKHTGYWMVWDEETKDDFAIENDYTINEIETNLNYFFEKGFFSKAVYEKHNILTGEEIQLAWLMCAKTRMRFVEGIVEPIMVVPFDKEIEENTKKFAKLNKIINNKTNDESVVKNEVSDLVQENSENSGCSTLGVTSINQIQHKAISVSKSEAISISRSKEKEIFHPTDVASTYENFSSTDSKINSISSELLLGGFETEKNISNSSNSTQINKKISPPNSESAKPKKMPHPARDGIIEVWEKGNNLTYVQDKENNMAIPQLIRKLEELVKRDGNIVTQASIIQKYTWLWTNKARLSDFLKKQYRTFYGIEKYFHDIVGDIRDNDKKQQSKLNQPLRQPAYMRLISEII